MPTSLSRADRTLSLHDFSGAAGAAPEKAVRRVDLPGVPQSHACVRLLARDASWVFKWGDSWKLDAKGQIETAGTPVLILGSYAFGSPAPWQAADYWTRKIVLPDMLPGQ